jgi:hypothetical protein
MNGADGETCLEGGRKFRRVALAARILGRIGKLEGGFLGELVQELRPEVWTFSNHLTAA